MRRATPILVLASVLLLPPLALAEQAAGGGGEETGLAAVYSRRLTGHRTASGERLNQNALTTSHKTLAFGTRVRITRVKNGKSVLLRVNDRGPTQPDRLVDITQRAAHSLGMSTRTMTQVKLQVVEAAKPHHRHK